MVLLPLRQQEFDSEQGAVELVVRSLASRSRAIFVRDPPIDPQLPQTSDLDFLLCADVDDLTPERVRVPSGASGRLADLLWMPTRWFDDPATLATHGLVSHRLLGSRLVYDGGIEVLGHCEKLRTLIYQPDLHRRRVSGLLGMGYLTVREVGITWDFPPLALFWLHIAHTACLAAVLDAMRRFCPNVHTRPLDYLPEIQAIWPDMAARWTEALRLDTDPEPLIAALRRIRAVVGKRFPEPRWPAEMRACTGVEYRYWLSPEEIEWRIAAAQEMIRNNAAPAAVFYLRFCAYALARAPMVHARAAEGRDVTYLRPEMAVLPELQRLCPEILDDLSIALAGPTRIARQDIERSLKMIGAFRDDVVGLLQQLDLEPTETKPWVPYRGKAPAVGEDEQ